MRRRYAYLLGLFSCVAAAVFVSLWLANQPTHRINDDNIRKIQNGMTLEQVEGILGVPAGDFSTRRVVFLANPTSGPCVIPDDEQPSGAFWTSNEARVEIRFNDNGRVEEVFFFTRWSNESFWAMLCRWMRFCW